MKLFTFLLPVLGVCSSLAFPFVDLPKYTGRWFQAYANPFSYYITENGGSCVIADYEILDSTSISILNSEIGANGKPKSIKAVATVNNPVEPGKLTVKFEGLPFNGTYWIYDIGPIKNGQYQYSIVSDAQKQSLFVLTRDLKSYGVSYEPKLREILDGLGFNSKNILTTPQTNCTYP